MEFLAPLMLLGTVGAAVPIAIHLYGRRRAPVRRFGAIDFLLGTRERVARRLRIRELLLLAVRVAACLAIPLALAKPFVSCAARGPVIERGPQAVVLLVDNSYAMAYRIGGETLLSRAKARAREVLHALGPEADVAVVFAAEGTEPPVELSRDHLRLADQIDDAPLVHRPADVPRAIRASAALLAGSPHIARRIYVFSSLTAGGFPGGEALEGPLPELHYIDVTGGVALPNLAVVAAQAERDPDVGARGVRVTAELANYGPEPVRERSVTLFVGGRPVARGLVSIEPGQTVTKRFSAALPAEGRGADVVVEIDDEGLDLDDRRYLHVELRREVRVLVVDGDPRAVRHEDETFYLETALRPGDRADSALSVTTSTVDDLPRRRLADYDVVFLCNVKPLEPARVAELEAWVRAGGGLFVSVGDHVEPDAYNRIMGPLLPQELRSVKDTAPGVADAAERRRRGERLGRYEARHSIFEVFSSRGDAIRQASFWRFFLVGPTTTVEKRRTLARFESGAPALVEASLGRGRVLLFLSSIDRDWNDLPIYSGYLPLVQQATRYLARAITRETQADRVVGRVHEIGVAPEYRRLEVTSPSGRRTVFEGARLIGRHTVTFTATDEPGVYHVAAAGEEGVLRPRPALQFVVNLDPRGSDTRRVAPERLPAGGSAATDAVAAARAPRRRVELWHGLAAALLVFLFGEALLVRRR